MHFLSISKTTLLLEIHFRNEVPGTFLSRTDMPLVHGWDPGKIWGLAIGSLDQLGGVARRTSPVPAAHSAGEVVGLDHVLTKGPMVAEVGAEGSLARAHGCGRRWRPRWAAVPVRGAQRRARRDPGRCCRSLGRCSRTRWPKGRAGRRLARRWLWRRGGVAGVAVASARGKSARP
jgi:hypothetical protein